jgi:CheY-like chemotaxis protein
MSSDASEKNAGAELRRVAHELNNLVAVLLGHAEALARSLDAAHPARKHVDSITEALARSSDASRRFSAILNGVDPAELGKVLTPPVVSSQQALSGTETVLLADDEVALRGVTARFLSMNGYKVLEAANEAEARAAYERAGGAVDVVVADVMMGATSGLDLARSLRGKNPALKVLFVSGIRPADMDDRDFLPKPFRPRDLLKRLREILDEREKASSG